jgi:hypothetical protein
MCCPRVERLPGQRHLQGDPERDLALQPDHAVGPGEQPAGDLGQSQGCLLVDHRQVAGQHDLRAAAEGEAVDRGDHRLVDVVPGRPCEAPLGVAVGLDRPPRRDLLTSVGQPLLGVDLRIVDDAESELPRGEMGTSRSGRTSS